MLAHVARRLVLAVSMVWAISFGAFCAFGLSFDPTYSLALSTSESDREYRRQLVAQFHLHDPILHRYWLWLSSLPKHGFGHTVLFVGRLGNGQSTDTSIGPQLWPAVWTTAQLVAVSLVLVVVLSVLVGTVSARWPGSPLDVVLRAGAYVSWSVPTFVVGVLVWRWLGPKGWFELGTPGGGWWSDPPDDAARRDALARPRRRLQPVRALRAHGLAAPAVRDGRPGEGVGDRAFSSGTRCGTR